jgi:two-component system response regulator MprA
MPRHGREGIGKILVVDDDESLTSMFKIILAETGFRVDVATTGLEALERVTENTYRVAIIDIMLPDMSGAGVARRLRDEDEGARIIIVTGYPDLAESIGALDIGVEEILIKPIGRDELLSSLRSVLMESYETNEMLM